MRCSYPAFLSSSLREHCPRSLDSVQSPVPKIKLSEEPGLTVGVGWGIKINHVHPISCVSLIFLHGGVPRMEHSFLKSPAANIYVMTHKQIYVFNRMFHQMLFALVACSTL